MNKLKQKQLVELLEEFFSGFDQAIPRIFTKDPVAKLLKIRLSRLGLWKNRPRGKSDHLKDFVKTPSKKSN
jgi:hypothetical protein